MSKPVEEHSYLKFGRAGNACVECGADLRTEEKHPSTLPPVDEEADGAGDDRLPEMFLKEKLPPWNKVVTISPEELDTTFEFDA